MKALSQRIVDALQRRRAAFIYRKDVHRKLHAPIPAKEIPKGKRMTPRQVGVMKLWQNAVKPDTKYTAFFMKYALTLRPKVLGRHMAERHFQALPPRKKWHVMWRIIEAQARLRVAPSALYLSRCQTNRRSRSVRPS